MTIRHWNALALIAVVLIGVLFGHSLNRGIREEVIRLRAERYAAVAIRNAAMSQLEKYSALKEYQEEIIEAKTDMEVMRYLTEGEGVPDFYAVCRRVRAATK